VSYSDEDDDEVALSLDASRPFGHPGHVPLTPELEKKKAQGEYRMKQLKEAKAVVKLEAERVAAAKGQRKVTIVELDEGEVADAQAAQWERWGDWDPLDNPATSHGLNSRAEYEEWRAASTGGGSSSS
jgi:hypothetical protein